MATSPSRSLTKATGAVPPSDRLDMDSATSPPRSLTQATRAWPSHLTLGWARDLSSKFLNPSDPEEGTGSGRIWLAGSDLSSRSLTQATRPSWHRVRAVGGLGDLSKRPRRLRPAGWESRSRDLSSSFLQPKRPRRGLGPGCWVLERPLLPVAADLFAIVATTPV